MRTIGRMWCGVLLSAALLPGTALALGFGDIRLKSTLNAPLDAEIEITATADELGSLRAGLASREQFARNGMEYPAFLNSATVRAVKTADGRDILQVRSTDPVTEPFLTMLVQVNYARGQLIREYTVLLDPPVFASQTAAAAISAPGAGTQARTGELERRPAAAAPAPQPTAPAAAAAAPANQSGGNYRVRAGDTLSGIAGTQYPGVNRDAALVGLYRANPDAFDGNNMNALRRGATLALPADGDLARVAAAEARTEVGRQYSAWADRRGSGRLRLVPPADTPAASGRQSDANLQQRVAELEQQLAEKDRLLILRNAELARLQQRGGTAMPAPAASMAPVTTPPAVVAAPMAPATEAPVAAAPMAAAIPSPAAKPAAAKPAAAEPETSMLDWVMAYWPVPVAAIALLAALALFLRGRRARQDSFGDRRFDQFGTGALGESSQTLPARQLPEAVDSIVVEETGSHRHDVGGDGLPAPTISVSDDGVLASEVPAAADGGVGLDQGDPLAEADFHMAYGLYDQAADLVNQAIAREPDRRELKLKLLEVYFVWGNKQKFETLATELSGTRAGAIPGEWEKIVIMGRQIAPENVLFTTAGSVAAASGSVDLNLEGGQNRIDFNLMGEPSVGVGDSDGVDLDLGEALAGMSGMDAGSRPPGESGVDFLLDTPVRGEGGELHTQMMPASGDMQALRDKARINEAPTTELPQLDMPEQGTIRMKLEGPAGKPANGTSPESTAELALDDLGLDIGTMETPNIGADRAIESGVEEEIILETHGDPLNDLDSGPEGNWLLQGTEDSDEHVRLDAGAIRGSGVPDDSGSFEEAAGPGHDLLRAHTEQQTLDIAAAKFTLPRQGFGGDHAEAGDLLAAEIDATLSGLSHTEQATQEMAAPTELLTGYAAGNASNAITAAMPSPESQYSSAGATSRMASLVLSDSDVDGQIGTMRALPVAPAVLPEMDPPTMSEVGTKLDLARAYMDMGDPEGARSILDEVLAEGSASQKQEARRLIDSLPG